MKKIMFLDKMKFGVFLSFALLIAGCGHPQETAGKHSGDADSAAGKSGKVAYKVAKETEKAAAVISRETGKAAKVMGRKVADAAKDAHEGWKDESEKEKSKQH